MMGTAMERVIPGPCICFRFSDTNFSNGTLSGVMGDGYTGGNNVTVGLDGHDLFGVSVR